MGSLSFMRRIFSRNARIPVSTSQGSLDLTTEEHSLLEKLLSGAANGEDILRLYSHLSARGLPFPPEWEVRALRVTLSELPQRDDLAKRLVEVEAALARHSAIEVIDRSTWERAWARFSATSLIGTYDANELQAVRARCFSDACTLLANPYFRALPAGRRAATIIALHDTLMSAPSPDLVPVAELGLRQFRKMLEDPELSVPQAMGVFDALHSMYFAGVSDVLDLRRFDYVVPQFEAWLKAKHAIQKSPKRIKEGGTLTVAYLLHTAHFDRGNAVSPLIVLLAGIHAKAPNRRVFLYLVQYVAPGFQEKVENLGFEVRNFSQGRDYERMEEIAKSLRDDGVDVVITEQNRAVATALYAQRVAPLQMWLDTGFPFWRLKSLDWTFSPNMDGLPDSQRRISGLFCHQPSSVMQRETDLLEVERVRKSFPPGSFVIGVFVRLIKINENVFDLLNRLLAAQPAFCLFIAGTGDAAHVKSLISGSAHRERIMFLNENVDLQVYGKAIDVMCDTFPFIGGHACREVGAQGTPVVSMLGTAWDTVLREERNPELLAGDTESYMAIVMRLFEDPEFREQQRSIALRIFANRADPERTTSDLEAGIDAAKALANGQA